MAHDLFAPYSAHLKTDHQPGTTCRANLASSALFVARRKARKRVASSCRAAAPPRGQLANAKRACVCVRLALVQARADQLEANMCFYWALLGG